MARSASDLDDVTLSFSGTAGSVLIDEGFYGSGYGIEEIQFADGTVWDQTRFHAAYLEQVQTAGNDTVSGFGSTDDTLAGGAGNDTLAGLGGSDTYVYSQGDGDDRINEGYYGTNQTDRLVLGAGLTADRLIMARSTSDLDDVTLGFSGTAGSIFLDEGFYGSGYGIEEIQFADGATWGLSDLRAAYLAQVRTDGNDTVTGFTNAADILAGGGGNDTLKGLSGDDTYMFGHGDGQDVVDNRGYASSGDKLLFGANIGVDQLWFQRAGNDLKVSIIGTSDGVAIAGWYSSSNNHVAQFATAGDSILSDSAVQNLVAAMAAFSPPPLGQTTLSAEEHQQLDTVIAANWRAA